MVPVVIACCVRVSRSLLSLGEGEVVVVLDCLKSTSGTIQEHSHPLQGLAITAH